MSEFQYKAGLGNVGNYQVSSVPYATSSLLAPSNSSAPLEIVFPSVTKFVSVRNTNLVAGSIKVGFSSNGVKGSNYLSLAYGESYTGEWRIEDLFLVSATALGTTASIIAGLTPIPRGVPSFVSTGNNWSGSSGVG